MNMEDAPELSAAKLGSENVLALKLFENETMHLNLGQENKA